MNRNYVGAFIDFSDGSNSKAIVSAYTLGPLSWVLRPPRLRQLPPDQTFPIFIVVINLRKENSENH